MAKKLDVALIIGIDHYEDPRLKKCGGVANADAVEKWFYASCAAIHSEPWVVPVRSGGGDAKQDKIIAKIGEICEKCPGPGSRLLFYFSGHGAITGDQEELLLCEDTGPTGIKLESVISYFSYFPFDKQVFVIDACRVLDDELTAVSVFTRRKNKPRPSRMHGHQRLILQSTSPTDEAYADQQKVQLAAAEPCAYFTIGLLDIASGKRRDGYRWIEEMEAMGIRDKRMLDSMVAYLKPYKQKPDIYSQFGEPHPWHAPLLFARLPKPAEAVDSESLFDDRNDRGECPRYREFIRALLAEVDGFGVQRREIHELMAAEKNACGAFYLAPIDVPSLDWLVRNVLFRDSEAKINVYPMHLTAAAGGYPSLFSFYEQLAESFSTPDRLDGLLERLTGPTVLYVVLDETAAEELAKEILQEFWVPLTEHGKGSTKPFHLLLTTGNSVARPAVGPYPRVKVLSPPAAVTTELVQSWVERFRHDLPLPLVMEPDAFVQEMAGDGTNLVGLVERICNRLQADPEWMQ